MSANGTERDKLHEAIVVPDAPGAPSDASGGMVEMTIGPIKDQVHMVFKRPMQRVVFDRDNAAHVGKHLIDTAVQVGAKVVINIPRRPITDEQRIRMTVRAEHILRSMLVEQGKRPKVVARNIVDSICAMIE